MTPLTTHQTELEAERKLRRLTRGKYDKLFREKHGRARRRHESDHALLLGFIVSLYKENKLSQQEAMILANNHLLKAKGKAALGKKPLQDVEKAQGYMAQLRQEMIFKFRIGVDGDETL